MRKNWEDGQQGLVSPKSLRTGHPDTAELQKKMLDIDCAKLLLNRWARDRDSDLGIALLALGLR